MNSDSEDLVSRQHAKAELECLMLSIALAQSRAAFYRTHPFLPQAVRDQRDTRHLRVADALTVRYEQRRRFFLRRFGAGPTISRVPTQLRRLCQRLFCRPTHLRVDIAQSPPRVDVEPPP